MTILLFSLFERFAVYDNEEGCARQQLKICPGNYSAPLWA